MSHLNNLTEMDKIVQILLNEDLTPDERKNLIKTLEKLRDKVSGKDKPAPIYKEQEPQLVLNERAATIIWATGLSVNFKKTGIITWMWENKKLTEDEVDSLNTARMIPPNLLALCFEHICGLHQKEHRYIMDDNIKLRNESEKTRYVHVSNKRAFVAGMILGQTKTK